MLQTSLQSHTITSELFTRLPRRCQTAKHFVHYIVNCWRKRDVGNVSKNTKVYYHHSVIGSACSLDTSSHPGVEQMERRTRAMTLSHLPGYGVIHTATDDGYSILVPARSAQTHICTHIHGYQGDCQPALGQLGHQTCLTVWDSSPVSHIKVRLGVVTYSESPRSPLHFNSTVTLAKSNTCLTCLFVFYIQKVKFPNMSNKFPHLKHY